MQGELEHMIFGDKNAKLTDIQRKVLKHHHDRKTVSTDAHADFLAEATFGERIADRIAAVGGSWGFIISFLLFLVFWVSMNTIILMARSFDPYPFIFLNLILSMLAAIQAPVIMMSQNRQSSRDRFMAAKDYEVNLKAELEVLALHQKIDEQVLAELRTMQGAMQKLTDEIKVIRSEK